MSVATQKIFRIRRDYNTWVGNETLEDYALRYTPRSFRKWSEFRVANTAFGATSFLALEAIGGSIAIGYGFSNALWAILVVGLITFLTGLPISYYAAKYGVDMDLLTRGAGFGYLGSTLTSLVYASFTFIFLALEAAILALALQMYFDWPLSLCYLLSSLGIVPLVMHGITLISRLQLWTQPLWLALLVCPYAFVLAKNPQVFADFTGLVGRASGSNGFSWLMFGTAATVAFSLVVQIGEQVDYLRFLPEKTRANRRRWWAAVLVAGPGWIVPGMVKMLGGAFLAFLALQHQIPTEKAVEPTQMYLAGFGYVFDNPAWILGATTLFVLVSQLKINLTNAYAGSLAWSNFFARLTHSHPGRVVWLVFNVLIAVLLMTLGVFEALERVLGLYSNVAIAWVGALVADLVINKPLGWSPRHIEFKRAHLYDINPVGLGAMLSAAVLAIVAYAGALGAAAQAFAPFIALATAMGVSPLLAWATRGRWYLARRDTARWAAGQSVTCTVCDNAFESEDMAHCPAYGAPICSLCCTLESRCHDRCKTDSRAAEQVSAVLAAVLPQRLASRVNFRVAHYLVVAASLIGLLAVILGVVYDQEGVLHATAQAALKAPLLKVFALLSLAAAVGAWWVVLGSESRHMAQDESNRQNQLLTKEIDAHRRTDAALQAAKDLAEAANQAKTRYVAGMTHELRTPLNSILGYAQILLKDEQVQGVRRASVDTIHRSGEHLHGLVDGLLDLARIEAGRLRLDMAPLPMHEFLDDLVRMVAPQAEAKGLVFTLQTSGRVPDHVNADAKRLRQILINLLSNAVRFTDRGIVTLKLDYRLELARFEVVDTGIGIAVQDQERIFLPFERGSAGRRTGEPGTGLGLTITHLLTQLMGGELSLKSAPGQGSTFTARLYLREIRAPMLPRRTHRPVTGYLGPRRSLLVVDDQPTQRQMLAGLLMPLGFRIREAASGRECLESVLDDCPDAVLLDVSMDDMDGWQTARQIRAAGLLHVPILMVSANAFENQADKLAAAGCQGFVDKPVIESELLGMLQRHLQIEWLAELALPNWAVPGAPERAGATALPAELIGDLIRLVRLGHLQGVQAALDAATGEHPAAQAELRAMQLLVERFELDALLDRLTQALGDVSTEAP
ncbi:MULTISPECIES: ATP-binding protein [unclassified Rhizobacter]|uniref:hybrid sensor histidine kinase/response regulator n=1 Tax=unclassified Rhizobacter TaxID=2640088 RepID=UPI0006F3A33A|nr:MULTISPECIES: ATP-binding protein [unclassified Rhizobacter]KQU76969.1 ATPase [Rhizobacter sp. Root29]KQV97489.1 ATPase [Rhizobacter sp. Root1238]KRB10162.1 ATPase [Rhizobacter sp. Root16D2]